MLYSVLKGQKSLHGFSVGARSPMELSASGSHQSPMSRRSSSRLAAHTNQPFLFLLQKSSMLQLHYSVSLLMIHIPRNDGLHVPLLCIPFPLVRTFCSHCCLPICDYNPTRFIRLYQNSNGHDQTDIDSMMEICAKKKSLAERTLQKTLHS